MNKAKYWFWWMLWLNVVDTISTFIGLTFFHFTELNPLGFIGAVVIKIVWTIIAWFIADSRLSSSMIILIAFRFATLCYMILMLWHIYAWRLLYLSH